MNVEFEANSCKCKTVIPLRVSYANILILCALCRKCGCHGVAMTNKFCTNERSIFSGLLAFCKKAVERVNSDENILNR